MIPMIIRQLERYGGMAGVRLAEQIRRETTHGSGQDLLVEWTHDSAVRFFPVIADPELGLPPP